MQDTVVLITGASKGIGAATARHLATLGAKLVLVARSKPELDKLAKNLRANGAEALAVACDVSRFEDVQTAVHLAEQTFGRLDVLINNAGLIDPIRRIEDSDPTDWSAVVDVNLKGAYYAIRAASPVMVAQRGGTIINISSGAATSALEGWSHYCATKAALLSLTRCAQVELGPKGVTVVGLSPGTVATDMQTSIRASGVNPVSRLSPDAHIPPEWVAQAIAYLCMDGAAEHAGTDFSLKTEDGRRQAGLPPLQA